MKIIKQDIEKLKKEKIKLQNEFLDSIKSYVEYWRNINTEALDLQENESEIERRLNGLAFSILTLIDGESTLNDCKKYHLSYGGTKFNDDCFYNFHEHYYDTQQLILTDEQKEIFKKNNFRINKIKNGIEITYDINNYFDYSLFFYDDEIDTYNKDCDTFEKLFEEQINTLDIDFIHQHEDKDTHLTIKQLENYKTVLEKTLTELKNIKGEN